MKTKTTNVERTMANYMKTSVMMKAFFTLLLVAVFASCEKEDTLESNEEYLPEVSVTITKSQLLEFLPCFCLYGAYDFEDDVQVPEAVKIQFRQDFPNARDIDWEGSKSLELYEVEFELKDKEHEALYSKDGGLIMTMTEIPLSRVPQAVKDGFRSHYGNGWKIDDDDADKIITSLGTYYKFEIENDRFDNFDDRNTFFDSEGNFIEDCFGDDDDDSDDKKDIPSGSVDFKGDDLAEFLAFLCKYDDDFDDFDDDIRAPQNVREQFRKDFPNASDIEWEGHERRQWYLVEFDLNNRDDDDNKALYDKDGKLLMTWMEISLYRVPKEVKAGIRSHYGNGWKIEDDDVDMIVLASGTYYKLELENDNRNDDDRNAIFDSNGRFIVDDIDD